WIVGTRESGLFDDPSAGANWSRRSRDKTERGYGRWLFWLRTVDALDRTKLPGERVTRERVADYVAKISTTCAPYTQVCRVQELYDAMRVLAPRGDWSWLAELLMMVRCRAQPVRNKRTRLRPTRELVDLGRVLMANAEKTKHWSPQRRAVCYRDGLLIALLAYRPVRLGNFASMLIGRHLCKHDDRWWLEFPGSEMKNDRSYDAPFPEALAQDLERYLAHHRPVLLAGEGGRQPASIDALWVSEVGTMLEKGALARRFRKHTRIAFGAPIPPHW